MSSSQLPERASLEYLKKLAKDRLHELRRAEPHAKLAEALLAVARDHGFSSWRALKAEVDRRQSDLVSQFFNAARKGETQILRDLLAKDEGLARAVNPGAPYGGWTALHETAGRGHADAVALLLAHGADPNAREMGDNVYPLHVAAANAHLQVMELLLGAGGDVHGFGDVHALDTIGWAIGTGNPPSPANLAAVALLEARGARHHIFTAIVFGDLTRIQSLVEQNPEALDRRMSRFEQRLSPLHFALSRKRYDIAKLLIDLGVDLEAVDAHGHTALAWAMLQGDREAMAMLHAAGAIVPPASPNDRFKEEMKRLGASVTRMVASVAVPDIAKTLEWYVSIGFTETARYEADGVVNFGMLKFGNAEIMLGMHGKAVPHEVSLWFYTDQVDEIYRLLESRQFAAAQASLAGEPASPRQVVQFDQGLEDMFYGARQFCVRDLNGYQLYFIKTLD